MYRTLFKLRREYNFQGYIHVKAIPGANPELVRLTGFLADRMSVNLELPTAEGLKKLAPNKHRKNILAPMRLIQNGITESKNEVAVYRHAPAFVPAGQSTQMIIGATGESDFQLMMVAQNLYDKFSLKRVFYSAFVQVNEDKELPALPGGLRCFGSTGSIRRTGCCGFMVSMRRSCWMKTGPISMCCWIPRKTGLCVIWNAFLWK